MSKQNKCKLNKGPDSLVLSALDRAETPECKNKILNSACFFKTIKSLDHSQIRARLATKCPLITQKRSYLPVGCYDQRVMNASNLYIIPRQKDRYVETLKGIVSEYLCIDYCLIHSQFAVFNPKREGVKCACVTGDFNFIDIENSYCRTAHSTNTYFVYQTGRGNNSNSYYFTTDLANRLNFYKFNLFYLNSHKIIFQIFNKLILI